MKVTCPISGIVYSVNAPVRGHSVHIHPMLSGSIKVAQLASWYIEPWVKGDLPATETHLLGISLLLKLPIESIGLPVMTPDKLAVWDKFWAINLEKLITLATKLEGKDKVFKRVPHLVVSSETITYLPEWLKQLETELGYSSQPISEKAKELNRASYKANNEAASANVSKLLEPDQIEELVRRALNNSLLSKNEERALPVLLADWAAKVTAFPSNTHTRWQRIIQTIFDKDYINKILMSDIKVDQIKALEEYLVLNTPSEAVGTSHSRILMERLSSVIPVIEDFNPSISNRKKGNDDSMLAAIMGGSPATKPASSEPKQKTMTLSERLALRLANKQAPKVINENDL